MNERFCPVDAAGFCPNYCKVMPCKLAKSPLELALDIYWNNHQPAIARSIDKLLDALKPQQPEPKRWAGRDRPDLPPMWLEDLGYDGYELRFCFHGECSGMGACDRLRQCIGQPPFVREQMELLAAHKTPKPAAERALPYVFWLGADA